MPKPPATASSLKRESAGRYATPDGRFAVEHASGGWMVTDGEHANELGMPLVRGPFATLGEARAAVESARVGPAPVSELAARIAALPPPVSGAVARRPGRRDGAKPPAPREPPPVPAGPPPAPEPPPILVRRWRAADGAELRRLWDACGLGSLGDDDDGLAAMDRRNPGLMLVATAGDVVVGSALGAWDGRRGWIYHVATAADHRRRGIGRRLVAQVEAGLRALGCPKVNVIVLDDNDDGVVFWVSMGYGLLRARQYGRVLADS